MNNHTYTMKWHNFLIYFVLIAGAIINILNGLAYMFGVHSAYNIPESFDFIFGSAVIGAAVVMIIARQKLATFSPDGPKWLMINYGVGIGLDVLYYVCYWMITETNAFTFFAFAKLVANVIVMLASSKYYENRAELFSDKARDSNIPPNINTSNNNDVAKKPDLITRLKSDCEIKENNNNERKVCPNCGTKQALDRTYCFRCGEKFE